MQKADDSSARAAVRHSPLEDVFGILVGTFIVSFGLFLLNSGGVVTGGTAGLSLLLGYAIPVPYWVLFFVVNLPFAVLAIRAKGLNFTLRSGAAILLVSMFSVLHPIAMPSLELDSLYAAVAGNVICGVGVLILFRHKSSLGGFNVVALVAQDRFGVRAGFVLMALDTVVVLSALAVVDLLHVLISALGAVILNLSLALNHRPDRYLGA